MIEQRSDAWFQERCGKVTASRVADVVARTKSGWSASRETYMGELIAERLTGVPAERYRNAAMDWGTEKEPQARAAYQFEQGVLVKQVGFVPHPKIAMTGASPDGLVGHDGLVELKNPNTATHINTLLGQNVPGKYVTQVMWQLACTGRQWVDFASYDCRLPDSMQLWIKRIERDDKAISELEEQVQEFLHELDAKVKALRERYEAKEMAA
jgi:putative phage-type endonuclease